MTRRKLYGMLCGIDMVVQLWCYWARELKRKREEIVGNDAFVQSLRGQVITVGGGDN